MHASPMFVEYLRMCFAGWSRGSVELQALVDLLGALKELGVGVLACQKVGVHAVASPLQLLVQES